MNSCCVRASWMTKANMPFSRSSIAAPQTAQAASSTSVSPLVRNAQPFAPNSARSSW